MAATYADTCLNGSQIALLFREVDGLHGKEESKQFDIEHVATSHHISSSGGRDMLERPGCACGASHFAQKNVNDGVAMEQVASRCHLWLKSSPMRATQVWRVLSRFDDLGVTFQELVEAAAIAGDVRAAAEFASKASILGAAKDGIIGSLRLFRQLFFRIRHLPPLEVTNSEAPLISDVVTLFVRRMASNVIMTLRVPHVTGSVQLGATTMSNICDDIFAELLSNAELQHLGATLAAVADSLYSALASWKSNKSTADGSETLRSSLSVRDYCVAIAAAATYAAAISGLRLEPFLARLTFYDCTLRPQIPPIHLVSTGGRNGWWNMPLRDNECLSELLVSELESVVSRSSRTGQHSSLAVSACRKLLYSHTDAVGAAIVASLKLRYLQPKSWSSLPRSSDNLSSVKSACNPKKGMCELCAAPFVCTRTSYHACSELIQRDARQLKQLSWTVKLPVAGQRAWLMNQVSTRRRKRGCKVRSLVSLWLHCGFLRVVANARMPSPLRSYQEAHGLSAVHAASDKEEITQAPSIANLRSSLVRLHASTMRFGLQDTLPPCRQLSNNLSGSAITEACLLRTSRQFRELWRPIPKLRHLVECNTLSRTSHALSVLDLRASSTARLPCKVPYTSNSRADSTLQLRRCALEMRSATSKQSSAPCGTTLVSIVAPMVENWSV